MRPRFMNRGSRDAEHRIVIHVRGFNEAPIHESGKWVGYMSLAGRDSMLQ